MDTASQCLARSADDEAAAAASGLPNERLRLERSALAWRLRAELIARPTARGRAS